MGIIKGYNDTYYFRYIKPETGRYTNVSTGTKDFDEAARFVEDFKANPRNKILTKKNVKISDFKKEVLKFRKSILSTKSLYFYEEVLSCLERFIGNKLLRYVDTKDIELYRTERLNSLCTWKKVDNQNDNNVSRATVNLELRTLKAIFNIAISFGYINDNPVNKIKQMKIKERQRRNFKDGEIKLIIDYYGGVNNTLMLNIFYFALFTGCRINEILNIQWEDIDIKNRIIHIVNKDNFTTKNFENRNVSIHDDLLKVLNEMLKTFLNEGFDSTYYNQLYLFSNKNGKKYSSSYVSHNFKSCLRGLGLPEYLNFHCTRYTHIGLMYEKGITPEQIQKEIGHKSLQTTYHYIGGIRPDICKAVNTMQVPFSFNQV